MRSVELLDACSRGDEARMEQLGWRPVLDALRFWPKRLNGETLAPYCSLLGDEDPAIVAAALKAMAASEYRPAPAAVYAHIHGAADPAVQAGSAATRRDHTPAAYQAVLDEVVMGANVCDCVPRSPQVTVDRHGVLRCSECDRLAAGQYDQAMEWAHPGEPEPPASTVEDVQRWARDEQLLRLRKGRQLSPFLREVMGGDDDAIRKLAASFGLSFEGALNEDKR
jgi:hypothetical protein